MKSEIEKKLTSGLLKIRVENMDLPNSMLETFVSKGIRTVGGVIGYSDNLTKDQFNIIESKIEELIKKEESPVKRKVLGFAIYDDKGNLNNFPNLQSLNQEILGEESKKEENILDKFSNWFGINKADLIGHSRVKSIVEIRHLVIYLLREYGRMSYPAIARLMGNRDHTTIIHAYNKFRLQKKDIEDFEKKFEDLIKQTTTIKERKEAAETAMRVLVYDLQGKKIIKRRDLTERETKMLELFREGLSQTEISDIYNISRERVRQIIEKAIRQQAVNESVDKGITINTDVLIAEEKKRNKKLRFPEKVKIPKEKRWSRFYLACKNCGTTTIHHFKKGLCEKCGKKTIYGEERDRILREHNDKCDNCNINRKDAFIKYERDLYITNEKKVFCKACFRQFTGRKLGGYKNHEWSRFHSKCIYCGTDSIPHKAKGLCQKCSQFRTEEERKKLIDDLGGICTRCKMTRDESLKKNKRGLYIDKENELLCRSCFIKKRHEKMSHSRF